MKKSILAAAIVAITKDMRDKSNGENPTMSGFLNHDQTTLPQTKELQTILSAEPVCLSKFYELIGVTFNSVYEMEMMASLDLGRIAAMEFKILLRTLFINYKQGRYATMPAVFSKECRRVCELADYPYIDMVDEMVTDYLAENETSPLFIRKIWQFLFTGKKYLKTQKTRLLQYLYQQVKQPSQPDHLAAYAIGYFMELGYGIERRGAAPRTLPQLILQLEDVLFLARQWSYSKVPFTLEQFDRLIGYFFENRKHLRMHGHNLIISSIILDNASRARRSCIAQKISFYEAHMGIKVALNAAELERTLNLLEIKDLTKTATVRNLVGIFQVE